MYLISLVLEEPVVWNEQYSLRVKPRRVLHPQKGKHSTEALSDLPEVTPRLHGEAGTEAYSFPIFKLEANTEGLCDPPREERTASCHSLPLHMINQKTLSDAPPDLFFQQCVPTSQLLASLQHVVQQDHFIANKVFLHMCLSSLKTESLMAERSLHSARWGTCGRLLANSSIERD